MPTQIVWKFTHKKGYFTSYSVCDAQISMSWARFSCSTYWNSVYFFTKIFRPHESTLSDVRRIEEQGRFILPVFHHPQAVLSLPHLSSLLALCQWLADHVPLQIPQPSFHSSTWWWTPPKSYVADTSPAMGRVFTIKAMTHSTNMQWEWMACLFPESTATACLPQTWAFQCLLGLLFLLCHPFNASSSSTTSHSLACSLAIIIWIRRVWWWHILLHPLLVLLMRCCSGLGASHHLKSPMSTQRVSWSELMRASHVEGLLVCKSWWELLMSRVFLWEAACFSHQGSSDPNHVSVINAQDVVLFDLQPEEIHSERAFDHLFRKSVCTLPDRVGHDKLTR